MFEKTLTVLSRLYDNYVHLLSSKFLFHLITLTKTASKLYIDELTEMRSITLKVNLHSYLCCNLIRYVNLPLLVTIVIEHLHSCPSPPRVHLNVIFCNPFLFTTASGRQAMPSNVQDEEKKREKTVNNPLSTYLLLTICIDNENTKYPANLNNENSDVCFC